MRPAGNAPVFLVAHQDDWSVRAPIAPSAELLTALKRKARDPNGGHSREPELPQNEKLVINSPRSEIEFDTDSDNADADAVQARSLNGSMPGLARSVSLDPDDDMGL